MFFINAVSRNTFHLHDYCSCFRLLPNLGLISAWTLSKVFQNLVGRTWYLWLWTCSQSMLILCLWRILFFSNCWYSLYEAHLQALWSPVRIVLDRGFIFLSQFWPSCTLLWVLNYYTLVPTTPSWMAKPNKLTNVCKISCVTWLHWSHSSGTNGSFL